MYIIHDVWIIIKNFLFHNIKIHGKHLQNDPSIQKYNSIIKTIPKPMIPAYGPRIIYSSAKDSPGRRYIKYIYIVGHHLKFVSNINRPFLKPLRSNILTEYQILPADYDLRNQYDELLRKKYFEGFDTLRYRYN